MAAPALLLVALVVAVATGSSEVTVGQLLGSLGRGLRGEAVGALDTIVLQIRVPRALLAALVGGGLGLAGAVYQGVFRNPLADPYLLGTAGGAGFGAALAAVFGGSAGFLGLQAPLLAFVFALASVIVVMLLAQQGGALPVVRLILAGVVLSSILGAGTSFLMLAERELTAGILARLLGGFSFAGWAEVAVVTGFMVPAVVVAMSLARALDVLQLGEEGAAQLGLPVESVKYVLLVAATLVTAAAVSVAGIIGFVGLMTPHAVRLLVGPRHRALLVHSLAWGATFMVVADLLARTVITPAELPVGIITALVGGPFFLVLLWRRR
ncbi:MAG TPA: iron ABC transporter permease [Trueperaceae bacterium]|nr:iron ABC transporter permease [Trueperaceae bacterium]